MSEQENTELQELLAQREELDKKIQEATISARTKALAKCRELLKLYNFTAAEIGLKGQDKKKKSSAKFIGPQGQLWSGKGRKPQWLLTALENGKSIEEFRIPGSI